MHSSSQILSSNKLSYERYSILVTKLVKSQPISSADLVLSVGSHNTAEQVRLAAMASMDEKDTSMFVVGTHSYIS